MKSKLLILFFALLSVVIAFNRDQEDHNLYSSDPCGYYLYLPAIFIYHDLAHLSFHDQLDKKYTFNINYSLHPVNGNVLNKYSCGVAIFELPFFLTAHLYCIATGSYRADGFTLPYQVADIFSTIFWSIAGLFVLRKFLKKRFTDNIVTATLLCIFLGTNLYCYTGFVFGMSHVYSFFLFACLLNITDSFYRERSSKQLNLLSLAMGMVCGLIFLARPFNVITFIIPFVWGIDGKTALNERILWIKHHYYNIFIIVFSFLAVAFIQFAYWKYITGHWLYDSYQGEGFKFAHPRIINGLFSYRKGWFLYTPITLICLVGFYSLWKKDKSIVPASAIFMIAMIYCVFSWREWWYGGSYGCRPLIECFAVLALPLAAFIQDIYSKRSMVKKSTFSILIALIILLNIFQTYQYSMGLIHWDRMTRAYYWKVFGRVEFDRQANSKYLIKEEDEFNYED